MFQIESFLEALDRWAEIAELDIDFSLFNEDLGDSLVIEEHLIELNKSRVHVLLLKSFLSTTQFFKNLVFFDLIEVIFALHTQSSDISTQRWKLNQVSYVNGR